MCKIQRGPFVLSTFHTRPKTVCEMWQQKFLNHFNLRPVLKLTGWFDNKLCSWLCTANIICSQALIHSGICCNESQDMQIESLNHLEIITLWNYVSVFDPLDCRLWTSTNRTAEFNVGVYLANGVQRRLHNFRRHCQLWSQLITAVVNSNKTFVLITYQTLVLQKSLSKGVGDNFKVAQTKRFLDYIECITVMYDHTTSCKEGAK